MDAARTVARRMVGPWVLHPLTILWGMPLPRMASKFL